MKKRALITGMGGQDGSYLYDFLIKKGYQVFGTRMKKRALITGINGQDGSYLSEFLIDKGYEVFGTVKRNIRVLKII